MLDSFEYFASQFSFGFHRFFPAAGCRGRRQLVLMVWAGLMVVAVVCGRWLVACCGRCIRMIGVGTGISKGSNHDRSLANCLRGSRADWSRTGIFDRNGSISSLKYFSVSSLLAGGNVIVAFYKPSYKRLRRFNNRSLPHELFIATLILLVLLLLIESISLLSSSDICNISVVSSIVSFCFKSK
jgi:hypothetical protein